MAPQVPTVGRIVHFYDPANADGEPRAAVIVAVWGPSCVNLRVLGAARRVDEPDAHTVTSVILSDDPADGVRWCWPPRA